MGLLLPILSLALGFMLIVSKEARKYMTFFYLFYICNGMQFFNNVFSNIDSHIYWSTHLCWFLNTTFYRHKSTKELYGNRRNHTIFLFNHRSIADFFVHDIMVNFQASYLARSLVKYAFPGTWLSTYLDNSVWYFSRGGIYTDKSKLKSFFDWVESNFQNKSTLRKSLIVYPEGHRNKTDKPLSLRIGLIEYAYVSNSPVQMVMAFGLENIIDENKFAIYSNGTTVYYNYSDPIFPKDYASLDEFLNKIKTAFGIEFNNSYKLTQEVIGKVTPRSLEEITDEYYDLQYIYNKYE